MTTWRNWAGTTVCKPQSIVYPKTVEEVQVIIRQAAAEQRLVKVVGHGDSYNDNFHTTGILLSLKYLTEISIIDQANHIVRCGAGVGIKQLVAVLAKHDISFPSLGTNVFDNIAGMAVTGHHGSGIKFGILSSFIESFDVVMASGKLIHVKKGQWLYDALGVNLGVAGIVTSITFKLEARFKLKQQTYPISLVQFESSFDQLLYGHDHLKLIWGPHTDHYQCWTADRTLQSCDSSMVQWKANAIDGLFINNLCHAGMLYIHKLKMVSIQRINHFLSRIFLKKPGSQVAWSDEIFYLPHLLKQDAVEYAVPIQKTVAFLADLKQLIQTSGFDVQFPIEVRFVKKDQFWLSPAYGQDMCYVGTKCHLLPGISADYVDYFKAVNQLVERYHGRPHWGKQLYSDPAYYQQYFPCWKSFWTLCQLLDPQGLFRNAWSDRIAYHPTEADITLFKQTYKCDELF